MSIHNVKSEKVDYKSALEKLGDSTKLYRIILVGFRSKYANAYEELTALNKEKKYDEACILSHSLKGVCGSLGATHLEEISRLLENAYRHEKDIPDTLFMDLKEEIQLVLCDIHHILRCMD